MIQNKGYYDIPRVSMSGKVWVTTHLANPLPPSSSNNVPPTGNWLSEKHGENNFDEIEEKMTCPSGNNAKVVYNSGCDCCSIIGAAIILTRLLRSSAWYRGTLWNAGIISKMADDNEGKDELPRCSTLFLSNDGSQMKFYMTPCEMKTRLRPLIHYGGGQLSSKVSADSIKLAAPGTVGNLSDYVSTEYIFDSIKYNKLQDMTNYRINSKIAKKLKVENSESKIQVR